MVGPSPLCPTPRHIVASTFRRGVTLAIGMRILDKNESSMLLGHREGARSRVLGPAARSGVVHTTIICPCDESRLAPERSKVGLVSADLRSDVGEATYLEAARPISCIRPGPSFGCGFRKKLRTSRSRDAP